MIGFYFSNHPLSLYPKIFFRLNVTTAYEYLEKRFDYRVRLFAALCFIGARVMCMSSMIYAASLVIATMLGWGSLEGGSGQAIQNMNQKFKFKESEGLI